MIGQGVDCKCGGGRGRGQNDEVDVNEGEVHVESRFDTNCPAVMWASFMWHCTGIQDASKR